MSAPGPTRRAAISRADWATPPQLFALLNAEFGFGLDAAASEENAKCHRFLPGPCSGLTGCVCGLCADWGGEVVWLNPPYGRGLEGWVGKCAEAAMQGAHVVALLPANTDTGWFEHVWRTASEIRFLRGRVQFLGTTSSNPCGSLIAVWRPGCPGIGKPEASLWGWREPA